MLLFCLKFNMFLVKLLTVAGSGVYMAQCYPWLEAEGFMALGAQFSCITITFCAALFVVLGGHFTQEGSLMEEVEWIKAWKEVVAASCPPSQDDSDLHQQSIDMNMLVGGGGGLPLGKRTSHLFSHRRSPGPELPYGMQCIPVWSWCVSARRVKIGLIAQLLSTLKCQRYRYQKFNNPFLLKWHY